MKLVVEIGFLGIFGLFFCCSKSISTEYVSIKFILSISSKVFWSLGISVQFSDFIHFGLVQNEKLKLRAGLFPSMDRKHKSYTIFVFKTKFRSIFSELIRVPIKPYVYRLKSYQKTVNKLLDNIFRCNFRNGMFNCWCCKTKMKKRYYNGKCFYISILFVLGRKKEADHVRSKEQSTRLKPFALQKKKLSLCWKEEENLTKNGNVWKWMNCRWTLIHWKTTKLLFIICFRNQLPSKINVIWRH